MEFIQSFLEEVTEELLYNIVYDAIEIGYDELRDKFEKKTGHRPMDFFGFGNKTDRGLFDFAEGIPGLKSKKIKVICDDDDSDNETDDDSYDENDNNSEEIYSNSENENDNNSEEIYSNSENETDNDSYDENDNNSEEIYSNSENETGNDSDDEAGYMYVCTTVVDDAGAFNSFNTTYLKRYRVNICLTFVAQYREKLLLKCCEIMEGYFSDLSGCKDTNGNTPLHVIAGLPGVTYDCPSLVKYLLRAGVDPLEANDDGDTFLHIVFKRFEGENDNKDALCVATTKWCVEDRRAVLNLLSKELSQARTALLAKVQDKNGNTVMHECALSTTVQYELIQENIICKKLIKFGASLRIPNYFGEVPLHYAFNPSVFQILVQKGAICRARNDRDETPVLFILKYAAGLAFARTSASTELTNQGFIETARGRSVQKAGKLLENLTSIISENEDARETIWIPDIKGNVAIDIVLIAIRIGSYDLHSILNRYNKLMQLSLVELLTEMLRNASPSDMKRQNKKGQSFLHVLLDMGDGNNHKIIEETELLQSAEILLTHNADVNAVDSEGCTALDIAYKHHDKGTTLYKRCAKLLIKNGAFARHDVGNDSSSPAATKQSFLQSRLVQRMSNLRIRNETRKLRSCPKRHLESANRLTDPRPNSQIAVVEKYRYSNEGSIGSGAFSTIFVAIKDENEDSKSRTIECRAYALKRLDKTKVDAQEIKREITTLLSISGKCENIINCYESIEDDIFQYLFLDLMDGDLREFVENESVNSVLKADPAKPVQVTNEIIKGLAYLHQNNFIHRDLKPGNILYTTDPTLHFKITDFGLTKNTSTLYTMTSTSGVAMTPGTRCWKAPELVSMKSSEHTKESDIFSLGLVLHYLLTLGKHPFTREHEEPAHIIERRIAKMQINIDKSLHPEAASFLQVLLTKDPSKRPQATYLNQHPFLWSESKKIEFLKAVGDQPEAVTPRGSHSYSRLEKNLQTTHSGEEFTLNPWDSFIQKLFRAITTAWKQKKYRTDKVIDLVRFIRNAYAHKQERSSKIQKDLDNNIFLRVYPFLVLDVFGVVQQLGLESRSNICQALSLNT